MTGKRTVEIRTATVRVGDDDWTIRTNLTVGQIRELTSGDQERLLAVLPSLILDHPYVDDDGNRLPVVDLEDAALESFFNAYRQYRQNRLPPDSAPAT